MLLYERNTKLTLQGIYSVKNFELIGLYILEPAEPLPPMTAEDIEFERFQTMAVFSIKDDLKAVKQGKKPAELMVLANQIVQIYGSLKHKINFTQNLRSPEDYVYKHALNVAILSALISNAFVLFSTESHSPMGRSQGHAFRDADPYGVAAVTTGSEPGMASSSFSAYCFSFQRTR